jgi:hydrophobic/amphiphilic exporter-1 (mainly G- bacteria), HAE1 family
MDKIARFAVEYKVTVSMFVLAIILLGYISLGKLGVDLFPDMNAPRIFVEIKAGERPPEEIEKQYIENIESQVIRQKGVSDVSSVCMVGAASITVEYNWGTDMDEAFLDLQKALSQYAQNSEIEEFTISQHDPNASPVMVIAISNPLISDMDEFRKTGENYIRNELVRLEGIADVTLSGIEEKEVVIETDQFMLKAYNVTTSQLVQQIQNLNRNASGGSIVEMGKKYIIKGTSMIGNLSDIENIVIAYKSPEGINSIGQSGQAGQEKDKIPVFLKDLAKVSLNNKKPQNIVHINGQRCLGVAIYKETGYNTVKAVENLNKALIPIKKAMPGYEFTVVQNQGNFISNAVGEVQDSALIGALIAVFVLFVFLRRIGLTIIVSAAIPISVIATFNLMYFNGLTINIMTLGGLALGAGMLVDNAIVVIENIFRAKGTGLSAKEAAIKGTAQVGGAIISSTLTTIVVFLPIVYLHGASGELFKDQAWTVTFSLIASLFVGILVIPMLFHFFYGKRNQEVQAKSLQFNWYTGFLTRVLNHKYMVLIAAFLMLVATVFIFPYVGTEFIPKSTTGEFSLNLKLSEGTQIERTASTVTNLESLLYEAAGDKISLIYSTIGPIGNNASEKSVFQNENTASLKIHIKPEAVKQSEALIGLVSGIAASIPDAEIIVQRDETALKSTIGTDEAALIVEVKGKEIAVIEDLTNQIKMELAEFPFLTNLKTSMEKGAPEIDLQIDRLKAGMYNLSADDISNQLKDILMGKMAGKFEKSGEMSDITIKMPEVSLAELNEIKLKSGQKEIPVYEIANIRQSFSPRQIHRRNQSRIGMVTADFKNDMALDKAAIEISRTLEKIEKPVDYEFQITGEEQKRKDAMSNLSFALILSVILVYMVLASQFESLIHPFTILLTIPLAGVGAVWAFFIIGNPLNMMALIGIIMLAGIAVNNSILLVDAINQLKAKGINLKQAIISAGQNRIRPILMTSLTTILALLPLTIGVGESASLRSPMAIAVIAGLTTSTLMSLVVIPCIYYVFERLKIEGMRERMKE